MVDIPKSSVPSAAEAKAIAAVASIYADVVKANGGEAQLKNRLNALNGTLKTADTIRDKTNKILSDCSSDQGQIKKCLNDAKELVSDIERTKTLIKEVMNSADQALSSATSAGLAKEFNNKRQSLDNCRNFWIGALIVSLALAVFAAICRTNSMQNILSQSEHLGTSILLANYFVSAICIGAPIWFAWFSTKQVSYYFRLSEDYAFKAAISASYEGFRRAIDQYGDSSGSSELQVKLLDSLVNQYNNEPLRYVDRKVAGMPVSEVLEGLKKGKKITDNLRLNGTKMES